MKVSLPITEEFLSSLTDAVIEQESHGNSFAESQKNDYMKKAGTGTAKGLMQLLDATGEELFDKYRHRLEYGESPAEYAPFNGNQNRKLGMYYLTELINRYKGDVSLALTAYHSGMGKVDKLLRDRKVVSFEEIKDGLGLIGQMYQEMVIKRMSK